MLPTDAILVVLILAVARLPIEAIPFPVGFYVTAACWFTASTFFANLTVTIARALTATCARIAPTDVPAFIAAQFLGGPAAMVLMKWLLGPRSCELTA